MLLTKQLSSGMMQNDQVTVTSDDLPDLSPSLPPPKLPKLILCPNRASQTKAAAALCTTHVLHEAGELNALTCIHVNIILLLTLCSCIQDDSCN